jgi:uncharacterized protein (TIGR00255 family)
MGMTGFGRAEGRADWGIWSWEIRSVNGKGLDVRLHTPSGLDTLDFEAKKAIKSRFARGNVNAQLNIERETSDAGISVDTRLLSRLARFDRVMSQTSGTFPSTYTQLLGVKGVVSSAKTSYGFDDSMIAEMLETLTVALDNFESARKSEGAALHGVLAGILDDLHTNTQTAETIAAEQPARVRDRFVKRLEALKSEEDELSEERIAQEAAVFAAKADVKEELDRLAAHIESGRELLASNGPRGRKLDFLCQELNREANTLCSKSASLDLTNVGLALKTSIDQFKEQVQNVE